MQVQAKTGSAAPAAPSVSKPNVNVASAKTSAVKVEQSMPKDQVTLSPAAKEMVKSVSTASNKTAAPASNGIQSAKRAIDAGNYTVLGTAVSGSVVVVLVNPLM